MGLHHHYYAAKAEPPPRVRAPYLAIQQRIGSMLGHQYEPPKDLPHQLLALLIELNNQDDDDGGRTASKSARGLAQFKRTDLHMPFADARRPIRTHISTDMAALHANHL
jgi:hypothetical protein